MRADLQRPNSGMLLNFITNFKQTGHGLPALQQALFVSCNFR